MKLRPRNVLDWINSRPRGIRIAIKAVGGGLGVAVLGPLLYFFIAHTLGAIAVNRDFVPAKEGVEIFVWSNGVHADVVVPAKTEQIDWTKTFPPSEFEAVPPNPEYVAIGWGDRGFYLNVPEWKDLSFGIAFKALFLPSETAMHITYTGKPKTGSLCKRTSITPAQYETLIKFIGAAVRTNETGRAVRIPAPGYFESDGFYEANGSYNFIGTCNTWTGTGLRQAGVRMGLWTPLASGVMKHLE